MMPFIHADQFLSNLNTQVVVRKIDGEDQIVLRPASEVRGQVTLPLEPERQLVWCQKTDYVLQGPCSDRPYPADIEGNHLDRDEYPMGTCCPMSDEPEGAPERSWLHAVLAQENMQPIRRILVYAECCGTYTQEYVDHIRRLFPEIVWDFPAMPDFCECVHMKPVEMAEALVRAEVLQII